MNSNAQKIFDYIVANCLTADNRSGEVENGYDFNFIDGDVYCDHKDARYGRPEADYDLIAEDIDAAYDALIERGLAVDCTVTLSAGGAS